MLFFVTTPASINNYIHTCDCTLPQPDEMPLRAMSRLESIAEVQGISDSEASVAFPPSAVDDQLASALTRGGSLEDFDSIKYVEEWIMISLGNLSVIYIYIHCYKSI